MAENQRLSESDTIILSLHERWWKKMLAGEKLLEIRKTRPAGQGPFWVFVYVTGTGTIQGEFNCNHFFKIRTMPEPQERAGTGPGINVQAGSCLTKQQLKEYAGDSGKPLWGWSVSRVQEYETPRPLSLYGLKRPPQSWQYYRGKDVLDDLYLSTGRGGGDV